MSELREHKLPNGGLVVSRHWVHGVKDAVTVPAADRPLYRLLQEVLADASVPENMPARLARECDDLVAVREAVTDVERARTGLGGASYGLSYLHAARDAIDDYRDREPLTLVAVGCSGSKHHDDGTMLACERYKGSYWAGKRRYYETVGDDGRIISAEHDVLHPQTLIEDYERTPDGLRGVPIDSGQRLPSGDDVATLLDRWALDVHEGLATWLDDAAGGIDPRDVELEVLLGRDYRDPLEERGVFDALDTRGALEIAFPFQEQPEAQGGMIQQIGWMGSAVDAVAATDGGEPSDE